MSTSINLTTTANDPDGDTLLYTYTVTGGRVTGEGAEVSWDLSGMGPGTYTASVDVDDGCGCISPATTTVTIAACSDCAGDVTCPTISSSCPDAVDPEQPITFTANVGYGSPPATSYNWTVSAGTITSGQGSTSITVSTKGLGGQSVTATIEVGGVDPSCGRTTSCTTAVRPPPQSPTPTPGGTPSPSPQPSASAGVSPLPSPQPSASADISPTPSPESSASPDASPSPVPSASASPEVKRHDLIKVTYPDRFLNDSTSRILFRFTLLDTLPQPTTTVINGNREQTGTPPPIPGATPGPIYQSYGPNYNAYASVTLVRSGLTITKEPDRLRQSLDSEAKDIPWEWEVIPTDRNAPNAAFHFHVRVEWIAKNGTDPSPPPFTFEWLDGSGQPFSSPVGPSAYLVYGATFGSVVPGLMGVGALSIGKKRRKRILDKILTTIFAPREVQPGNSFMIQVFAHVRREAQSVEESARLSSPASEKVDQQPLDSDVERGTTLKFNLRIPELKIDETSDERVWRGTQIRHLFSVSVPTDFVPRTINPRVTVFAGEVPLGHLGFDLRIVGPSQEPASETVNRGQAGRYKQAFISYAHQDQMQVEVALQMLDAQGQTYFYDVEIKPGEQWGSLLYKKIDESDAFFLFWSEAASKSEWVEKEIDRALGRQSGNPNAEPAIFPYDLTPPADPPVKLRHLNFNNRIRRMWLAAEQLHSQKSAGTEQGDQGVD